MMIFSISTEVLPEFKLLQDICMYFERECEFDFDLPFTFKFLAHLAGDYAGDHCTKHGHHIIRIRVGRTLVATVRTIFHELYHALQAEGLGAQDFNMRYAEEKKSKAHDDISFEKECNSISRQLVQSYLSTPQMIGHHYLSTFSRIVSEFNCQ